MGSPVTRSAAASRKPAQNTNRSRVTNGKGLFVDTAVDARSGYMRRFRDLLALHINDLGGEDVVSAAERSIIRRGSALETELELLERKFALSSKGASAEDLDLYGRNASRMQHLYESVGLKRRARDITPETLDDIAREIEAEKDNAD